MGKEIFQNFCKWTPADTSACGIQYLCTTIFDKKNFVFQSGSFGESEQSFDRRVKILERIVYRTKELALKTVIGHEAFGDEVDNIDL